jgi:methylenetetrahydrofolate reductase (NADPH)
MARISDLLDERRTFSFEFFPPKNEAGWLSLGHAIAQLEDLQPDFVSVTYGAGGSTRTKTHDLVSWVHRQASTTPMAHLTCQGHTRADIRDILIDYRADFAITQFFFEVDHYVALVEELAELGVTKPVIPGIMPVTNLAQVSRMATMSGTEVPRWLIERVGKAGDDPVEANRIGAEVATELCQALLEAGAPGLHFYTLNRSATTRTIAMNLGLGNAGLGSPS